MKNVQCYDIIHLSMQEIFRYLERIMERLFTRWGKTLDKNLPLNDYPRPQMKRDSFINLNGEWNYAILDEFKKWIIDFPNNELPRIYSLLKKYNQKHIVVFNSHNDIDEFLMGI